LRVPGWLPPRGSRLFAPALAQDKPLRIGIIAPRSGAAGTAGECGIRAVQWATERMNKDGGIAGRKFELGDRGRDQPERYDRAASALDPAGEGRCHSRPDLDRRQPGVAPVAEEEQALVVMWDGTTQDGVKEMMPNPKYVFRSTDNECEAVMGSLLAVKHFKGKFKRVAGINPDYSYGRNNWEAFKQILARYGVEAEFVAEQWPKVGTMDLTSHVAALNAAKPDLIFSSMLFADLPVFMKQGHAAGLFNGVKMVLPAAGWQINQLKKEFTPEGIIFGHNTLYFDHPQASPLQKAFVQDYMDRYKEAPHWERTGPISRSPPTRPASRPRKKPGGKWPTQEQVAEAMPGLEVESLGGKGRFRKDKIAEQVFYQGPSTNNNKYDFPTLASIDTFRAEQLQKPPGADFWEWIKTAKMPV
jgi:branched-chain amino acid transport system substrate-binding protein